MSPTSRPAFPCNSCGKCCRNVANSEQTAWLDRGDSVCIHFDETSQLCSIYETRPLVCRVEDYYEMHLKDQFSWADFVRLNQEICRIL